MRRGNKNNCRHYSLININLNDLAKDMIKYFKDMILLFLISNKVRNIVFCIFYCNLLQFYRESFCLICKQCRDYLLVTEIYLIYPQIFVKQEMEITCAVIIFDQKLIKIFKHLVHREENERCVPTLFIGREETRARTLAREFMPICLVPSYAAESHSPAPLSRF